MTAVTRIIHPGRIGRTFGAVGLAAMLAAIPACGGDDQGGADDTSAPADFCTLVVQTALAAQIAAVDDEFGAGVERALGQLADRAPTDDLRAAMETFAEHAEQVDALDPDDPEQMWDVIELLGAPSFIEANEVLNTYLEETCGFGNAAD